MSRSARLGAFILGTLAILAIGIFIIGSRKYLFERTYELRTQFTDVAGLQGGADVLIGGVHGGTVKSINLPHDSSNLITVILEMNKATQDVIKQDSVASIQTEGLLGNQYVSVAFGSPNKPGVQDGQTIASVPPFEMSALLDKANSVVTQGQKAMAEITQVATHLNSVSTKIDDGTGTVGKLVNDKEMYNNLNETATTAKVAVGSAQKGIVDFQENMEALKHNFLLRGYFKNRGYEDASQLGKDEIAAAPEAAPVKNFDFQSKQLFDKQYSAKFKGQKALKQAGDFLAGNDFGVAVIEVSTGSSGDSDSDMKLAEGRALVVRDYLVQHFGFDDTKLKTVSLGKQIGDVSKDEWGEVKILIYPPGTPVPPDKNPDSNPDANPATNSATPAAAKSSTSPSPSR
jgi:phospholipid/cholesterol/gamma-HCH transport system substrate-binding protein